MHRTILAVVLVVVLVLAPAGCTSVTRLQERDRNEVRQVVQDRVGVAPATAAEVDDEVAPELLELLKGELSEDAAVKIALLNSPEVREELAGLGVASSELIQAGLLPNPLLTLNAKVFSGGTEVELGVVQPFLDVVFLSARKRVAESELEAAKAHVARDIIRLAYDVRRALVGVRAAQRLVEVEQEVLRAAQASLDLMAELHRAGNVIDQQLTAEEVGLLRARLALAEAQAAVVEAREQLGVLMGLSDDAPTWRVASSLSDDAMADFDLEQVESRAVRASLDLAENRAHATAEARRAGMRSWEAVFSTGEAGLATKREASDEQWGWGPAAAFSLPVFDTGGARRAASEARLRQALARDLSLTVQIRSTARRFRERLTALQEQAEFIRSQQLPSASRLVRETLRNYNAMQTGAFEVLVVKQQEIDMARSHVEKLRDAWRARLDLEELLAGSLNEERRAAEPAAGDHSASNQMNGGH